MQRRPFFPGQGGIAGLVKSLALEWPGVHCKVVGLDAESPAALQAEQLLLELTAGDGLVEVGYHGERRRVLQPRLAPLEAGELVRVAIDRDWVVLVTGGARGITAEVAAELAERELASPHGLKAALLEAMRQSGAPVTVAQVEAAYQRLLKDREIRANLARMERAGSRVRYVQADARDEGAMRSGVGGVDALGAAEEEPIERHRVRDPGADENHRVQCADDRSEHAHDEPRRPTTRVVIGHEESARARPS